MAKVLINRPHIGKARTRFGEDVSKGVFGAVVDTPTRRDFPFRRDISSRRRDDFARHDVALDDRYDLESGVGTTDGASTSSDPGASFSSRQLDRSSTSIVIDSDVAGHI